MLVRVASRFDFPVGGKTEETMPELWTALEKKLGMLHGPKDGWPEIRKGVYPLKSQVSKPRTCAFGPVRSRIEILRVCLKKKTWVFLEP